MKGFLAAEFGPEWNSLHPQRSARWGADASRCVRRAGMRRLCEKTCGSVRTKIAVIDGLIETRHPSLEGARIQVMKEGRGKASHSTAAAAHATFIASVLAGSGPDVVGLCPQCLIVNIPAIDDEMLNGQISSKETARRLVEAIELAEATGAKIIQLSLDLGFGDAREGCWIAEVLAGAVRSGVKIIMAAGQRALVKHNPLLWVHGVIPVTGADSRGVPLYDIRWGVAMATRGLSAPGADVPGAVLPEGSRLRSGSSFAACFVTAALALLCDAVPGATLQAAALALFACAPNPRPSFSSAVPRCLDGETSLRALIQLTGGSYVQ